MNDLVQNGGTQQLLLRRCAAAADGPAPGATTAEPAHPQAFRPLLRRRHRLLLRQKPECGPVRRRAWRTAAKDPQRRRRMRYWRADAAAAGCRKIQQLPAGRRHPVDRKGYVDWPALPFPGRRTSEGNCPQEPIRRMDSTFGKVEMIRPEFQWGDWSMVKSNPATRKPFDPAVNPCRRNSFCRRIRPPNLEILNRPRPPDCCCSSRYRLENQWRIRFVVADWMHSTDSWHPQPWMPPEASSCQFRNF